jgi:DNA-binding transcriptional MerR regulator
MRQDRWTTGVAKKLYYKIGEACKILDVKPFVLRYWETEFPFLNPSKSRSGQRIYSERDLAVIRRVNELLNVEGYTIAGARKKLQGELEPGGAPAAGAPAAGAPADGAEFTATASRTPAKPPAALDTEAQKKVKRLRSGIEEALREARGILEVLGADVTKSNDSAA